MKKKIPYPALKTQKSMYVEITWRFQAVLLCLNFKKKFQYFVIFSTNESRRLYFLTLQRTRLN